MEIRCVWEHNGNDTLLYAADLVGAFTRGASRETALEKMPGEIFAYMRWRGQTPPQELVPVIVEEKESRLQICDADSDVLFAGEREMLTVEEYQALKALAMKSAADFLQLYMQIPDLDRSCLPERKTFYGAVPRTARQMYEHTKNVNAYYFSEIGVDADNSGTIVSCREQGFAKLETAAGFLENPVYIGSDQESWSLRKVMRRFVWHDRIHARAMYKMARTTFPDSKIADVFSFGI